MPGWCEGHRRVEKSTILFVVNKWEPHEEYLPIHTSRYAPDTIKNTVKSRFLLSLQGVFIKLRNVVLDFRDFLTFCEKVNQGSK